MIEALLKGKLSREQENMEDILTSNVFGLMKYLSPEEALFPFLAKARDLNENRPLAFLLDLPGAKADYRFWPWWPGSEQCPGCEPDLLLRINSDNQEILVVIEAKYRSGKSSVYIEDGDAPEENSLWLRDQLARQWDGLWRLKAGIDSARMIVYLTAHFAMPKEDIDAAHNEHTKLAKKGALTSPAPNMCWLSWRHLAQTVKGSNDEIKKDLHRLLSRLSLRFFEGSSGVASSVAGIWSFKK